MIAAAANPHTSVSAKSTVEIVGLCIAVLTMQPALVVACTKALLHGQIVDIMERSIVSALSQPTAAAQVDAAEDSISRSAKGTMRLSHYLRDTRTLTTRQIPTRQGPLIRRRMLSAEA